MASARPDDEDETLARLARHGRGRTGGPAKANVLIGRLLNRTAYGEDLAVVERETAWREAAGVHALNSQPGRVRAGVLEIAVRNSVVLQELTFRKTTLLAALKARLPLMGIVDLRFRVARWD